MQTEPEKLVTFYNSYGYQQNDEWRIPMRIWIRERADLPLRVVARVARGILQKRAGLTELTEYQKQLYKDRTHAFIADRESWERVPFMFDNDPEQEIFQLNTYEGGFRSDRNGLLEGEFKLPVARATQLLQAQETNNGWLNLHTVSEKQGGTGKIRLIPPTGLSIISDIDDTIKITEIPKGQSHVLNNTFFQDFKPAPGMADMYQSLGTDTAFHYVSGAPWQLYHPLHDFLFGDVGNYPEGSMHMKNARTSIFESESYGDFWKLFTDGSKQTTFNQKVGQISTLLKHFPQRKFILIGDSGERDPEVFRHIKDLFPEQIEEIRIRDVLHDPDAERLTGMTVIPTTEN